VRARILWWKTRAQIKKGAFFPRMSVNGAFIAAGPGSGK